MLSTYKFSENNQAVLDLDSNFTKVERMFWLLQKDIPYLVSKKIISTLGGEPQNKWNYTPVNSKY